MALAIVRASRRPGVFLGALFVGARAPVMWHNQFRQSSGSEIMYAVVRTGGKQYRVAQNDVIRVERLAGESGDEIVLGDVLMVGGEGEPKVGSPTVAGAAVKATIVDQIRADKVIVFKKKRRTTYRRKRGHRQQISLLRITAIEG
jgi:large subunit ribosomal protein L21